MTYQMQQHKLELLGDSDTKISTKWLKYGAIGVGVVGATVLVSGLVIRRRGQFGADVDWRTQLPAFKTLIAESAQEREKRHARDVLPTSDTVSSLVNDDELMLFNVLRSPTRTILSKRPAKCQKAECKKECRKNLFKTGYCLPNNRCKCSYT